MLIGSLNLQIMEEVFFTEIEPHLFISNLVRHAMILANTGVESRPIHEGDLGTFWESQNPFVRVQNKVFRGGIPDFLGGSSEFHRTARREEKARRGEQTGRFPDEKKALAEYAV